MPLLDHHRTWHFDVQASPEACVNAFVDGLTCRAILHLSGKWKVGYGATSSGMPTVVGTYEGRDAVAVFRPSASRVSLREQTVAIGSTLTFRVLGYDPEMRRTLCAMAMTEFRKVYVFFTADARFFRGSMNRVLVYLRRVDPELHVAKS